MDRSTLAEYTVFGKVSAATFAREIAPSCGVCPSVRPSVLSFRLWCSCVISKFETFLVPNGEAANAGLVLKSRFSTNSSVYLGNRIRVIVKAPRPTLLGPESTISPCIFYGAPWYSILEYVGYFYFKKTLQRCSEQSVSLLYVLPETTQLQYIEDCEPANRSVWSMASMCSVQEQKQVQENEANQTEAT